MSELETSEPTNGVQEENNQKNGSVSISDETVQTAASSNKKKKNKKKKKKANVNKEEEANTSATQPENGIDLAAIQNALATIRSTSEDPSNKQWKFWDTQPVPKIDEAVDDVGKIEPDKEHVREESYSLPNGFEWDTLDLGNSTQLEEVYQLLNENYVEDEDNMFRFDYSAGFLQWALRPPGWIQEWHCGVRAKKSGKLVAFISAIPAVIKVYENHERMVEINFLCVHKKLRSKRVAPVLIREITRRVNLRGIFQAVYTAGVLLPKPVAKCRYYHRSLNPKKLVDIKFSHIGRNQTMNRLIKLMRLPETTEIPGIRKMETRDVPQVFEMLSKCLSKFKLAPILTPDEVSHFLLPRDGIVDSYVVEDENGVLTDFSSFFSLPSSIMHHPEHKTMYAAYSYYTVANKHTLTQLMKDILIIAKQNGYDVFNSLDLMDNGEYLKDLKFGMGDGNLHYYLYNYKCPELVEKQIGLVLQ